MQLILPTTIMDIPSNLSLELINTDSTRLEQLRSQVPTGSWAYLPHISGKDYGQVCAAAENVLAAGFTPVAHIGVRSLTSGEQAREVLGALQQARVQRVLLLAGDPSLAQGPYSESLQLLQSGWLPEFGITSCGFAAHPEGLPGVSAATLQAATVAKLRCAREQGLSCYLVSQFAFDASAYVHYLRQLRLLDVEVKIYLGVAGSVTMPKLLGYARQCGIGNSLKRLYSLRSMVLRLLNRRYEPGRLLLAIDRQLTPELAQLVAGVHLFPFGAVAASLENIRAQQGQLQNIMPMTGKFGSTG